MGFGMPSVGVLLLELSPEHCRGADSAALNIADVTGSAVCVGIVGILIALHDRGCAAPARSCGRGGGACSSLPRGDGCGARGTGGRSRGRSGRPGTVGGRVYPEQS